jgi:Astacin (Peptidase family M12A)/FG-GAP-like repeat
MADDRAEEGEATASPDELLVGPDVREGYVVGETFDAKPVKYSVVDGLAIFEGDIVLGTVEQVEQLAELIDSRSAAIFEAAPPPSPEEPLPQAVIRPGAQFRWAEGIVPFQVDANLPAAQVNAVNNAINHWRQNTRLNLVQRNAGNAAQFPDFIEFFSGTGCSSPVGRQGGRQRISLAGGCFTGQAIHEIAHSIGLWHEQSREDRDTFVRINWANIQAGMEHNFDQHVTDGDDVGAYEYGSIMHYPRDAFTRNGQDTITALQALPAGVTMGQRNGLSAGDRAAVRFLHPDLEPSLGNTYRGDFDGDGKLDLLYYLRSRMTWYHGTWATGTLAWTQVGDTTGFGQVGDGRPFWAGDFDADGRTEVIFYFPGDGNWWLGKLTANQLQWTLVSNTLGGRPGDPNFGQIWDGRPFWIGNFSRDDCTEVLFYFPGDDNWWIATWGGTGLLWSFVGNTIGFGHAINDGRPFWAADFDGDHRADILFYYPGDGNWWLGSHVGGQLTWKFVGNTLGAPRPTPPMPEVCRPLFRELEEVRAEIADLQEDLRGAPPGQKPAIARQIRALRIRATRLQGQLSLCIAQNAPAPPAPWPNFGQVWDGRPFWVANLSRPDRAEVLFYYPGDGNWWLGTYDGDFLQWTFAGNTEGFGHGINDGRPFWIDDFNGDGRADVLFYYPGDDNWWLGVHQGGQIQWNLAGNTIGFGHAISDGRPFWTGRFARADQGQMLFYFPGDGNCWLGTYDGNTLQWSLEATFEA